MDNTLAMLGNDDMFLNIALVAGMVHTLRCMPLLESPLLSLCCAIIVAVIYRFLASFLLGFTPIVLIPLLSIVLIISMIYYVFFKKTCQENVKVTKHNDGNTLCFHLNK